MNENPVTPIPETIRAEPQRNSENIVVGAAAGLAAALLGAAVWAAVTYFTKYQIGFMAVGVGYLVGWAMRRAGNGHSTAFGVVATVLAILGCLVGNLLSSCAFIADETQVPMTSILRILTPSVAMEILREGFTAIDALFYFLAIGAAFRNSRAE